jgi:C1A family cysteine protease
MLNPRISRRTRLSAPLLLVVISFLIFLASTASAQLTAGDIQSLQQQVQAENLSFQVGENAATQYPIDQLCGMKPPPDWQQGAPYDPCVAKSTLPSRFDWRELDGVVPIRNQGGCGSCWAFGTIGSFECAIKIQDNETVDLSEQWLVSCNQAGWGCDGGWWAFSYFTWWTDPCDSSGAVMESDFPYAAADLPCYCPYDHPYHLRSWSYIGDGSSIPSVTAMKQAILDYGPISVSVYVDGYFQAYNGGVFDHYNTGTVNHAVVLVGWDDSLGPQGAWILRNSWGPNWGEDGYMYIAYGYNMVGYAACYVNYEGGASFTSDTRSGAVPFDVNFSGLSGLEVDSWNWDFGDGISDTGQYPTHTYTEPGMHSVSLDVCAGADTCSRQKVGYIMALADTLAPPQIKAYRGSVIEVPIRGRNYAPVRDITIPIEYSGDLALGYEGWTTEGCRTDYFAVQNTVHEDHYVGRMTVRLVADSDPDVGALPPGDGPLLKLRFRVPLNAGYSQTASISVSGYSSYLPRFSWPLLSWNPVAVDGSIGVAVVHGDVDAVTGITVADLTYMVSYFFGDGPDPVPLEAADVNCDDDTNIFDITFLVDYIFGTGDPPPDCM